MSLPRQDAGGRIEALDVDTFLAGVVGSWKEGRMVVACPSPGWLMVVVFFFVAKTKSSPEAGGARLSVADDDAVAPRGPGDLLIVGRRGARILVAAPRTAAVDAHALTLAGDAVPFAHAR